MWTAAHWLEAWERARHLGPPLRPTALLAAAGEAGADEATLLALPLGERDRRLLALRGRLFGGVVECLAECPACRERVELDFEADPGEPAPAAAGPLVLEVDGHHVEVRPPDSLDLAAASRAPDVDSARQVLLARCVLAAEREGLAVAPAGLPGAVLAAIDEALSAADSLAAITLDVTCPTCGHAWAPLLDPGALLWEELDRWVAQLFREVHLLAAAYGWAERDILAMSPLRRGRYLELAREAAA